MSAEQRSEVQTLFREAAVLVDAAGTVCPVAVAECDPPALEVARKSSHSASLGER